MLGWHGFDLSVDGTRSRIYVRGEGRSIVFVPSPFLLTRTYRAMLRPLADRFRVISVELPGSGHSDQLNERRSFAQSGEWLSACVDALRLDDRPLAIGHSNSGGTLIHAAAARPQRFRGMVLVGSVGAGAECGSLPKILLGRATDVLREPLISIHGAPDILFNLVHHPRTLLRQVPLAASDCSEIARRVTPPVLLAWGRHDRTMRLKCAERFAELMPDARIYVCERGSHNWLVEFPREFVAAVAGFDAAL